MVANSSQTSSFGVDGQLTDRALRALLKHHEASSSSGEKEQLLGDDLDVQVQFSLARIPGNASPKPIRIEIPHPLVKVAASMDEDDDNLQDVEACLIVKEESKPWVQEMVARFPSQLGCIKKVLGLQSLRVKHKSFTQRRELLDRFDVFFADDRILPMLTKALGGKFFEKKKQPIPIKLTRKEALPFAVQKCLSSTFMYLSAGTCVTVKAGNTAMPPAKLLANIQSICSVVPTKVPRKWSNIRSISIKTTSSVALPVYNKTPEELEQLMSLARGDKQLVKEVGGETNGDDKESKKKRKAAASTPLAKAVKKQKVAEAEDGDEGKQDADVVGKKLSKKKKKERKESIDAGEDKVTAKTPKSSKKERRESKAKTSKTPIRDIIEREEGKDEKSSKKKTPKKSSEEGADFVSSKKFSGFKKGYVFRKGKSGLGYYIDVKPVVDKAWLSSLGKAGRGGGRKSMGHPKKKKKSGHSRRSY